MFWIEIVGFLWLINLTRTALFEGHEYITSSPYKRIKTDCANVLSCSLLRNGSFQVHSV